MPICLSFVSRILSFLCWIVLFSVPIGAAGELSVSGTITDTSGSAVRGATVRLYTSSTALPLQALTADSGGFVFENLTPGTYFLEYSKEGFQNQSRRIALEDSPETLRLTLAVAGVHQRISVIASELPELPSEVAKAVSLVSAEELAERGARMLSDALQLVPALQIQQLGGPGTVVSYRFRGLRPTDTSILLDGFRFRDAADERGSARPLVANLLATGAERIEVLRGAGSALYGTNAMGGTVNVISRQPTEPWMGSVSLGGGSLGLLEGGAEFGGQAIRQRLSYLVRVDHRNYTRGIDDHDASRNNSGSAMAAYRLSEQAQVFLRFRLTDAFTALNESPSPLPNLPPLPAGVFVREAVASPKPGATFHPQFDDPDNHERNRFYAGAARLDQQINGRWVHSAGFQSLRTRRRYDDGPAVSQAAQQLGYDDGPGISLQRYEGSTEQAFWRNGIQVNRINSAHVSFDFDRETLDQTAFGLTTEAAQKSLALAVQNQTRLLEGRFHMQAVFQAQWYDLDLPRFSDSTRNPYASLDQVETPDSYNGDGSVAYFIARTGTKLRAHTGNGYRAPSLYERFGGGGSGAFRSYYGNPQLRPERSIFVDGGLDQYLLRDRLQLSATYFYTHLGTLIDFGVTSNDAFGRSFGYLNRRGGQARGVEVLVSSRPASFLDLTGSYTFTKSNQASPTSAGTTRVLGLADHQFSIGVAGRPTARIGLHAVVAGTSSHDFPVFGLTFAIPSSTYRFPGYARVDLTGSYTLYQGERGRAQWVTRVENLLNREYYHGGFLVPKATVRSGVRFEF